MKHKKTILAAAAVSLLAMGGALSQTKFGPKPDRAEPASPHSDCSHHAADAKPAEAMRSDGGCCKRSEPASASLSENAGTPEVKRNLGQIFDYYLLMQFALASDNAAQAAEARTVLRERIEAAENAEAGVERERYRTHLEAMQSVLEANGADQDLESLREGFRALSDELIAALQRFGHQSAHSAYLARCSMAFENKGAQWLQAGSGVSNPYFGSKMPRCGAMIGMI